MKLTQEQKGTVLNYLAKQDWKNFLECPICHQKGNWDIPNTVFELRQYREGKLYSRDVVMPLIVMVCEKCGNAIFFSAIRMGIVEKKETGVEHD